MNNAFYITAAQLAKAGFENTPDELLSAKHLIYSSPATLAFNSPGAQGFGVKRAVGLAYREAALAGAEGRNVYTMGPIIHNEAVVGDLREKGVRIIDDQFRCEEDGSVPPAGST